MIMLPSVTAIILLGLALAGASAEYIPLVPPTNQAGGSSLTVYPSPTTGLASLTVVLAPCTGLQIHTHNASELAQASPANTNPIKMAYVDLTNAVVSADVAPGARFAIPAGLVHFQYNAACTPASFIATVPITASTQLVVGALQQFSAEDYAVYATTPAAQAVPGFFATSQACLKGCPGQQGRR